MRSQRRSGPCRECAFTRLDVIGGLAAIIILLSLGLPTLARTGGASHTSHSLANLVANGAAHALYAADWNGRQLTVIVDGISMYGDDVTDAVTNYSASGEGTVHPPMLLGWGSSADGQIGMWHYPMLPNWNGNHPLLQPITFSGSQARYGAFRMYNAKAFHDYLTGRYHDPFFYSPNDVVVHDIVEFAFDRPWEYDKAVEEFMTTGLGDNTAWSSYALSPAAFYHPDVFRSPPAGGWQDPWSFDEGLTTPGFLQPLYPGLKVLMVEHHWNQNPPAVACNPAFAPGTYAGCEPWYFNHGLASAPASLFYDLHVRLLPNAEAVAADALMMTQTGYGLWSRDTPFGPDGYLSEFSYDGTQTSHIILTTDGIRGRDTLEGASGLPSSSGRQRSPWLGSVEQPLPRPRARLQMSTSN